MTMGIHETRFKFGTNHFVLVDVGGQRTERKRWLQCFHEVTAVLYLTAINEYDMVLEEDESTNRLVESLKLWKMISLTAYLKNTPFILFLNKIDLFKEKIKSVPLSTVFKDFETTVRSSQYAKMDDFEKSWRYIAEQFKSEYHGNALTIHPTCALDTDNCKKVFEDISSTLLRNALEITGF